jgi:hypothetical protein
MRPVERTSPVEHAARALVRCAHACPSAVRGGVFWCPSCGALRLLGAGESWFRPGELARLARALGPAALSESAAACHRALCESGPSPTLAEASSEYGRSVLFELIVSELVTVDEGGRVQADGRADARLPVLRMVRP